MQILESGAHIKVSRTTYTHHGIYCCNDEVVHYTGFSEPLKKGSIEITSLSDFLGTEYEFDIVSYPISEVKLSPEEVMERALSRLHEDNYNIAFNNCEHFACWCITGKRKSAQVRSVVDTTTAITASYQALTAYKKSTATLQTAKLVAAAAGSTAATTGLIGTTMGVVWLLGLRQEP